jgi:hypothetical protein
MSNSDVVPVIVAALGSGGAGLFLKDLIGSVGKLRRGVSARETQRRIDIIQQRDEAIVREDEQRARADASDIRARNAVELVARLRVQLLTNGIEPLDNETWTAIQSTLTRNIERNTL